MRYLLLPFSIIYGIVLGIRNTLYNYGIFKSVAFDVPVISVGNLTAGGTGKTPTIEMLIRILSEKYTIGVLSRGYGRKSRGFRWVASSDSPIETGDEPLQIKKKYSDVWVAVDENRVNGLIQMLSAGAEINLILLDDAFQHRAIRPYLQILLCDYNRPFFRDFVLPVGLLREFRSGYKRADAVIVSKCPEIPDKSEFEKHIRDVPLFYSKIRYPEAGGGKVFGFSAIANNEDFKKYLDKHFDLIGFTAFPDHHRFNAEDMSRLEAAAGGYPLLCTDKDKVKVDELRVAGIQSISIVHEPEDPGTFEKWLFTQLENFES